MRECMYIHIPVVLLYKFGDHVHDAFPNPKKRKNGDHQHTPSVKGRSSQMVMDSFWISEAPFGVYTYLGDMVVKNVVLSH